jgi:tetratricopeptide (TPR) repeat protein
MDLGSVRYHAMMEFTPERTIHGAFAKPSPYRSPSQQQPQAGETVQQWPAKHRETLKHICGRLVCATCKEPAAQLYVDEDELVCLRCAADDAVALPATLNDVIAEVRSLFADVSSAEALALQQRPKIRIKRPVNASPDRQLTGDSPSTFNVLNPNITPTKPALTAADVEAPMPVPFQAINPAVFDGIGISETRERDDILADEAQERITLQKGYAVAAKQAKAAHRESSRQQKALGDKRYEEAVYDAAIEHYSAAIRTNDGTSALSAIYGNRSAAYFMLHAWEECVQDCLASITQDDVKHPHTRVKLLQRASKASACLGDLLQAADFLTRIPDTSRSADIVKDLERFQRGAEQLAALKDMPLKDQGEALRMLVAEFGESTPLRLQLAQHHMATGDYHRALHTLDLIGVPTAEVQVQRARALYMQGFERVPEALKVLETCASGNAAAEQEFERVTAMETGKQTGNTLFANGKFGESVEQYTVALKHAADVPNIRKILFCNRAASYKEMKMYREGVQDCSEAIAIDAKFGKAYTRRARCLLALECFEAATRDFQAAIRLMASPEEARNLESELRGVERAEKAMHERERDLYWVLDVLPTATDKEMKKQYKVLSLKWHPDKNVHCSEDERKLAEHKFKRLSEAYATLSDELKRREYDLKRQTRRPPGDPMGPEFRYYDAAGARGPRYQPPPPAWQRQPSAKFW